MAYSVKADILEQISETDLSQLSNDTDGSSVVDSVVDAMIEKADNQINSYLRGKQTAPLPLDPVPPRVKDWSVGLAIYNLYGRRVQLQMPEPVKTDHDDIMTELRGVRDGKILIDDPNSPANTGSFYKASGASQGTTFTSNNAGTGNLDCYYDGPQ